MGDLGPGTVFKIDPIWRDGNRMWFSIKWIPFCMTDPGSGSKRMHFCRTNPGSVSKRILFWRTNTGSGTGSNGSIFAWRIWELEPHQNGSNLAGRIQDPGQNGSNFSGRIQAPEPHQNGSNFAERILDPV